MLYPKYQVESILNTDYQMDIHVYTCGVKLSINLGINSTIHHYEQIIVCVHVNISL